MSECANLAKQIAEKGGVALRRAAPESLSALEGLRVPGEAITFFREFEPAQCADIDGVRLWPVQEILAENKDYVPGCYIIEFGYVVFATTLFGDAFCFDLNGSREKKTPIVLISHDGYDREQLTAEEIAKFKKAIAPDFTAFLRAYVDEAIDIEPNYESST